MAELFVLSYVVTKEFLGIQEQQMQKQLWKAINI